MLIIVDSCGVLFSIDSHIHGTEGAVNVCFHPDSLHQVQNFGVWLDQMLTDTKGVSLPFFFYLLNLIFTKVLLCQKTFYSWR